MFNYLPKSNNVSLNKLIQIGTFLGDSMKLGWREDYYQSNFLIKNM